MALIPIIFILASLFSVWLLALYQSYKKRKVSLVLKQFGLCFVLATIICLIGVGMDYIADKQHDISDGSFRLPIYSIGAIFLVLFIIPTWGAVTIKKLSNTNQYASEADILDA